MIKVNARLFAAAWVCVSTEESRYYLNGVRIEPLAEGCVMVATDGHRLIAIRDPAGTCDEAAIVQPSEYVKAALYKPSPPRVEIWDADGNLEEISEPLLPYQGADRTLIVDGSFACVDNHIKDMAISVIDGQYPDWRRILPGIGDKQSGAPPINAKYLRDFTKIASLLGDKWSRIRIIAGKSGAAPPSPCLILFPQTEDAFGVLMPTKDLDNRRSLPDWIKEPS